MVAASSKAFKLVQAYQHVFRGPEGEMVLHDLLKKCQVLKPSFNRDNPRVTDFNEGMRFVALGIMKNLQIDVAKFEKMLRESEGEEENE
jgi:hypothetical protein